MHGRSTESLSRISNDADRVRIIAQTPELRVVEYVLKPGDRLSWHHHSQVTDWFYCLEGLIDVELRDSAQRMLLRLGEKYVVPPGVVHRSGNAGDGTSRYLLIQGIGSYDFIKDSPLGSGQ